MEKENFKVPFAITLKKIREKSNTDMKREVTIMSTEMNELGIKEAN